MEFYKLNLITIKKIMEFYIMLVIFDKFKMLTQTRIKAKVCIRCSQLGKNGSVLFFSNTNSQFIIYEFKMNMLMGPRK